MLYIPYGDYCDCDLYYNCLIGLYHKEPAPIVIPEGKSSELTPPVT